MVQRAFEVVLICEKRADLLRYAQRAFPSAVAIQDVTMIPSQVSSGELQLQADLGFGTFECQSETSLQQLNATPDRHTADHFRGPLRFHLMQALGLRMMTEEAAPPNDSNGEHSHSILEQARAFGYYTKVDVVDAAFFGASTPVDVPFS